MQLKTLSQKSHKSFSLLAGINRPVNPSQVTKLAESINKMSCIRPVVVATIDFIDGKARKYIIDGQHLFYALIRNNQDIPYTEIKVTDKKDLVEKIALLNASSKAWTMVDYITSWSCVEDTYKKLLQYYNTYDLELGQVAELFHKNNLDPYTRNTSRLIKRGEITLKNEVKVKQILDNVTDILKIVPRMDRKSNKIFVALYVQFLVSSGKRYNHPEFLNWLKTNKEKFATVTQDPEQITKLLEKSI